MDGPNYVVTSDGTTHALVVPSGAIRVAGDLDDLAPCSTGTVTFAFAGKKSIVAQPIAGGPEWLLRPVVRVREVVASGTCPSRESDDENNGESDHGHHGEGNRP